MYTPKLSEDVIRTLYRVRTATSKPMTVVADSMIRSGLANVNKHIVCANCVAHGTNDCANCLLAQSSVSKSA